MSNESDLTKELIEKIHQFLLHQIESNRDLPDASRESLTVASECIEQSYPIRRQPPSNDLLDIYKSHKQQSSSGQQSEPGLGQNPAAFLQNLASTFLSQATSASPTSPVNGSSETTQTSTTRTQTSASEPKPRKQVSDAEKLAAESFKNQGNDFMRAEDFNKAHESYSRAIEIDNNNAIYYSNRAAASSKLGDHQAALKDCKEAISIDPNYSKAYGRMGLAYATLENHQKAKEAYKKAVELDPDNVSYQNNLKAAEEKLAEQQSSTSNLGLDPMSILRNIMNNPQTIQMALRTMQDPRVHSMFGFSAQPQTPAGTNTESSQQATNTNTQSQPQQQDNTSSTNPTGN